MAARWIERRFERLIWKFRLISIVPVVLSLLGSVGCFVIGAIEVFNAFLVIMRLPFSTKSVAAKTIAQMVGGVDYFVIGIALLIFGYGIYELVISDLDPRLEGGAEQHTNILSVNSLQSLKNNLSNVIVVGLIVAAFKKNHWLRGEQRHRSSGAERLCGHVGPQRLVDCSQPRHQPRVISHTSQTRLKPGLIVHPKRDAWSTIPVQLTQQPIGLIESPHRIGGTTRIGMFFKGPLFVRLPNGAQGDRSTCLR